jgi:hypothetical protein
MLYTTTLEKVVKAEVVEKTAAVKNIKGKK